MRCALFPILSVFLAVSVATAGEDLLKDGGFEQVLDKPDGNGISQVVEHVDGLG